MTKLVGKTLDHGNSPIDVELIRSQLEDEVPTGVANFVSAKGFSPQNRPEKFVKKSTFLAIRPSDFPMPIVDSGPYMGTNVSATSKCHQCC